MSSLAVWLKFRKRSKNWHRKDRARLREWFDAQDVEETDELLAAIDEGIRSAETERTFSLKEVRAEIKNGLRSPLDGEGVSGHSKPATKGRN